MTTSPINHWPAYAVAVQVTVDTLTVDLADGRSISAPLAWYPRLGHGTAAERAIGVSSVVAKGCTGPTWTRTSASIIC